MDKENDTNGKLDSRGSAVVFSDDEIMTFAEWYESKVGIPLEYAKQSETTDLSILEEAFNFNPHNKTKL